MKKLVLFYTVFLLCVNYLFSLNIKKINSFILEHKKEHYIHIPGSFIVTDDNYIYLTDRKEGNLKIFDIKGNFIKSLWRKGRGPNEFVSPHLMTDYQTQILVTDFQGNSLYVFNREPKNILELKDKVFFITLATDFHFLNSHELLMSGRIINADNSETENYGLFKYNFETNKYHYLIPSHVCYGYKTQNEFNKAFTSKMIYIGIPSYLCVTESDIFFVYTGALNILKLNRTSKKISFFGKKTSNYTKPYVSPELIKAYNRFDRNNTYREKIRRTMSFVLDLFAINNKEIGLIYSRFKKNDDTIDLFLQVYDSSGTFIKEFLFMNTKAFGRDELFFYYKKNKNLLHVLETKTDDDFEQFHVISVYKIEK